MTMNFGIGVDLGGTNLRIAAISEQGKLLEKSTTGTKVKLGRDAVIDEMTEAIKELASKFRDTHRLLGIGVGVPGIIHKATGLLRDSPNLPGWGDFPVRDEIERRLGTTVILENDANAAALGEAWLGAGQASENLCMITLGTGIGGGFVLNGRIWQGMTGMAGEIGHIVIDPGGPKCPCGSHGCAEQFASATAVVRMAREAIASGQAPELARANFDGVELNAQLVYDLAIGGDKPAQAIFQKVGWALGLLLSDLVNALNLGTYVIGGGLANGWVSFAPAMFEELHKRSFVYAATAPDDSTTSTGASTVTPINGTARTAIVRARLGSDAGLYGAARLPMMRGKARRVRASA